MAPRFILGVIIVLVGVSLLLDQLDFEPAGHVMRFWPVILVAVGFLSLSRGRRGSVTGVVLIFLGGWLLLNTLGWLMLSPWEFIVPIAVVAVGARVMMRNSDSNWRPPSGGVPPGGPLPPGSPNNFSSGAPGVAPTSAAPGAGLSDGGAPSAGSNFSGNHFSGPPPADSSQHATIFSVLSSSRRRWGSGVFRSAEATCMMGGGEIDLRDAQLGPDGTAYIDVFVLMGGLNIFVPPGWTVICHVMPIMGGVMDKTRTIPSATTQQLILRGTTMMGGVEISN
jgi:predicted membrane protein